jgi:hypothetical protein
VYCGIREGAQNRKSIKFDVAIQLDEPFLDPGLKKLVVEWKELSEPLMAYKQKVEENKGVGFPLYEAPREDSIPYPDPGDVLRKKIEAML